MKKNNEIKKVPAENQQAQDIEYEEFICHELNLKGKRRVIHASLLGISEIQPIEEKDIEIAFYNIVDRFQKAMAEFQSH